MFFFYFFPPPNAALQQQVLRGLPVRRSCHGPCHVHHPLLTCYLAWHFRHNHFGLSYSVLWQPDVCRGYIFLGIHTVLIKIKNSYLCVCVCVYWMSPFIIHKAIAELYNTVILSFTGKNLRVYFESLGRRIVMTYRIWTWTWAEILKKKTLRKHLNVKHAHCQGPAIFCHLILLFNICNSSYVQNTKAYSWTR